MTIFAFFVAGFTIPTMGYLMARKWLGSEPMHGRPLAEFAACLTVMTLVSGTIMWLAGVESSANTQWLMVLPLALGLDAAIWLIWYLHRGAARTNAS